MKTHRVFDVYVNDLPDREFSAMIKLWLKSGNHIIFTPNAELILYANRYPWFAAVLAQADMLLPDSISISLAITALTNDTLSNRRTGIDSLEFMLGVANEYKLRVLFLGASTAVLKKTDRLIKERYPEIITKCLNPGVVELDSTGGVMVAREVINDIKEFSPDLMVVALGAPKQEVFILRYMREFTQTNIAIGVGGALDMLTGEKPRASRFLRARGFEWAWRLLLEPTRIGRIIKATVIFPIMVALEAKRRKRLWLAIKRVLAVLISIMFKSKL